uniref:Uncharacterized protein n=1 Tax=Arundo donax TaxID=35708 RepID=A0A0A9AI75_ARUDO
MFHFTRNLYQDSVIVLL